MDCHVHTHAHTYTHTTRVCVCVCLCLYDVCGCVCACTCAYECLCMHVCVCLMCVCLAFRVMLNGMTKVATPLLASSSSLGRPTSFLTRNTCLSYQQMPTTMFVLHYYIHNYICHSRFGASFHEYLLNIRIERIFESKF